MKEDLEWKEYPQAVRYLVSKCGEIYDTKLDRIMSQFLSGKPQYKYINVSFSDGNRRLMRVHRLVAETWVAGETSERSTVDHIDRDKFHNHANNLRWASRKEQARNRDCNFYVEYGNKRILLVKLIEQHEQLKSYNAAHTTRSLYGKLVEGKTIERAVLEYTVYKEYKVRSSPFTKEFLDEIESGKILEESITTVYNRLQQKGWTLEDAKRGYLHTGYYGYEVDDMWFKDERSVSNHLKWSLSRTRKYLRKFPTPQEGIDYSRNYTHSPIITTKDFTGTQQEAYTFYNTSEAKVHHVMRSLGVSFEEAIADMPKPGRVIKHEIDGVVKRNVEWYRYFGLFAVHGISINSWHSRNGKCLKKTLEHFGIDTSGMDIKPYLR